MLSAAENLNFSLSQWRRRPRTSRQASRGSRVGVQFSPIDSNSRSRYRRLWQQVGDAEVEQTNGHWRPSHHTFYHSGWSTQATHRQIQQISVAVWNNSQPNFFLQKKDKFGGWFDALITDDDNCAATIEELEARVPGLSEGKWWFSHFLLDIESNQADNLGTSLQVPVPYSSSEQGRGVVAFLRDKTSPSKAQEPCPDHWQGGWRVKVSQGGIWHTSCHDTF